MSKYNFIQGQNGAGTPMLWQGTFTPNHRPDRRDQENRKNSSKMSRYGLTLMACLRRAIKKRSLSLIMIFFTANIAGAFIAGDFRISREVLEQAEKRYGENAKSRLVEWEEMIRNTDLGTSDRGKLEKVNHFFNSRIEYVEDVDNWGVEDYWATPFELLSRAAGDCEDYAIAKYFTLGMIGVEEAKLNIMYVTAHDFNMAHMVVAYYNTPDAEPLILDNLVDDIVPASERTDLTPVFGFNGSGLWMAKQRSRGELLGRSNRLASWRNLQKRMSESKLM